MSDFSGSAFPTTCVLDSQGDRKIDASEGMTLRDYFAAKAITSVMQNAELPEETWPEMLPLIGRFCYAIADAMLNARNSS